MGIVIVVAFFAALAVFGLAAGWQARTRAENVFYLACLLVGFVIVLLRSLNVPMPDPTMQLTLLAQEWGFGQ